MDTGLARSRDRRTRRAACDIASDGNNRAADGISQSDPVEPPSTDPASLWPISVSRLLPLAPAATFWRVLEPIISTTGCAVSAPPSRPWRSIPRRSLQSATPAAAIQACTARTRSSFAT